MIEPARLEVFLAAGYAGFLILVASLLEWLGRHSHRRSGQFRTAGFKYHHQLDVWECPTGRHLHRHGLDPARKIRRYRASAHHCNACHQKAACTDSHDGREIVHHSEDWIETQAGRFHRVLSLTLALLALVILGIEMFRHPTSPKLELLGCMLILVLARGRAWLRQLRRRDSVPLSSGWAPGASQAGENVRTQLGRPNHF